MKPSNEHIMLKKDSSYLINAHVSVSTHILNVFHFHDAYPNPNLSLSTYFHESICLPQKLP